MKIMQIVLVLVFSLVGFAPLALAESDSAATLAQGEKLVQQVWSDMKSGNVAAIEKYTAQGFQSMHQDGPRTRAQEIKLIEGLRLGDYTLSDFTVTQTGPVIIATYFVSVAETIDGERLSTKPSPRISVFLETDSGWQWIVHGNFKVLK
ncbi:MAG: hypothetical protein AUJ58_09760 [Zetaproteobacteria bacterium CG1_02_55_237]|nr:MAG: hypothetical protein AUJ58_09760 [Zetaproteobacteria bacterium CG1_02_55_237]